jgi:hypothetical protein
VFFRRPVAIAAIVCFLLVVAVVIGVVVWKFTGGTSDRVISSSEDHVVNGGEAKNFNVDIESDKSDNGAKSNQKSDSTLIIVLSCVGAAVLLSFGLFVTWKLDGFSKCSSTVETPLTRVAGKIEFQPKIGPSSEGSKTDPIKIAVQPVVKPVSEGPKKQSTETVVQPKSAVDPSKLDDDVAADFGKRGHFFENVPGGIDFLKKARSFISLVRKRSGQSIACDGAACSEGSLLHSMQ